MVCSLVSIGFHLPKIGERQMTDVMVFRVLSAVNIGVAALLVGSSQLNAQPMNARQRVFRAAKPLFGREALANNAALTIPPPTAEGTFITFDVPGAVNGTFPQAVNQIGVITGWYGDNVRSGFHGFVRSLLGTLATFDVPNAVGGTFPSAINDIGVIAGYYNDNVGLGAHGFVRTTDGSITTFDLPATFFCCSPMNINLQGAVAGGFFDANFFEHSFLRTPEGKITIFDPPNAVGANGGSAATAITLDGTILGVYFDANSVSRGYRRNSFGAFTDITGPNSATGQIDFPDSTNYFAPALSINLEGTIAGTYFAPMTGNPSNPFGGDYRGFVKYPDGHYATFDAAQYPPCCLFTAPSAINLLGTVVGFYNDGFSVYHGFLRTANGTITTFDAPGAGTGGRQGTVPIGITLYGVVVGVYIGPNDGNFFGTALGHGFLFLPR
jgi:hypothetical protein